jgi:hypothetical protein
MSTLPAAPAYPFFKELARIVNSGQSRSVLVYGNIHDLYFSQAAGEPQGCYVPLLQFLSEKCQVRGLIVLVYELNGPIRAVQPPDMDRLRTAWVAWKLGLDVDQIALGAAVDKRRQAEREALQNSFGAALQDAIGKPTVALEFLRQLTICSRSLGPNGRPFLADSLLVIVEAADLLLPAGSGDISHLNVADRSRVGIVQDWFGEPGFMAGDDSVVLLAESASLVHPRVARLPSVMTLEAPAPDQAAREHYIHWFLQASGRGGVSTGKRAAVGETPQPRLWGNVADLAAMTAGLSVHAVRQLLLASAHDGAALKPGDVVSKVEDFICAQLGDDVVEFKKPEHSLDDVVGFSQLKRFIAEELIPRFRSSGPDALSGAAVAGPIGGGKTFIFESVAASLGLPVLVLKNIRSQWFGQTDVIFERLRRVLEALGKVIIVVDEADTQFGGVGPEAHETERRLTGKIQQMMSDPRLRGRVIWLLMTARIHLLSPDIRRPGRVGDLIIPVLDPHGDDRQAFLRWVLQGIVADAERDAAAARLDRLTEGYSAAAFASLRSNLKAKTAAGALPIEQVEEIVRDHLPPAIELARRYQTLQALINCTRRSLLPDPNVTEEERQAWQLEVQRLEARGVR